MPGKYVQGHAEKAMTTVAYDCCGEATEEKQRQRDRGRRTERQTGRHAQRHRMINRCREGWGCREVGRHGGGIARGEGGGDRERVGPRGCMAGTQTHRHAQDERRGNSGYGRGGKPEVYFRLSVYALHEDILGLWGPYTWTISTACTQVH